MATKLHYYRLSPLVLNQAAPVPIGFTAHFDGPPTSATLHLAATGSDLVLTPDATGTVFSGTVPAAALLTGLTAAHVNRAFIGYLIVTDSSGTHQWNVFGDVVTSAIPPVSVHLVAADVQFSDYVVNIQLPALPDTFSGVPIEAITQKFFTHFGDEYDFLQIIFARAYAENRYGLATRNDVQGIGLPLFNSNAVYGSAGRLTGITVFPFPTFYDGISVSTLHEMGHRWMVALHFPPFANSLPHWPVSDLAADIMGYNTTPNSQGLHFDYTLQPVAGGNYKVVPDSSPKKFSDLSQYLMGLRPASHVGSHFVFNNQTQTITAGGTLVGPVTAVTINDVIAHFGPRLPDFAHAQKRFRVAAILVTESALASVDAMRLYDFFAARSAATAPLAYTDGFVRGTALPFSMATDGVGRLDPRIKRHILIDASRDGGVWWFPQAGPFSPTAAHQGKALAEPSAGPAATPCKNFHVPRRSRRPCSLTSILSSAWSASAPTALPRSVHTMPGSHRAAACCCARTITVAMTRWPRTSVSASRGRRAVSNCSPRSRPIR